MAGAEHRLFLWEPHHAAAARREVGLRPADSPPAAVPPDAIVVPACLLFVARDLLLFDPPRVLAWRLLHEQRVMDAVPGWLRPLLPSPPAWLDRDPLALLLAALATGFAAVYLALALTGRRRAWLLGTTALAVVVAPSALFMAMGAAMDRPYGQDGGVVQLPLALEKIVAGHSPYGADYSRSVLGRQARRSEFWDAYGDNPILRHHAYLPGTHLVMLPGYLLARGLGRGFDPRWITLLCWAGAAAAAARLVGGNARGLAAAALVLLNPLVYWHQTFGANDLLPALLLLLALLATEARGPVAGGALLGLACATKQLAWPYAPFLLVYMAGAPAVRGSFARGLARPLLAAGAVFVAVVAPLASRDPRAFWADIVGYNLGLGEADRYPFGGTPGFGLANFVIYFGGVRSLRDDFPLGLAWLAVLPLLAWLLRWQVREGGPGPALVAGSAALLATLYVSRIVHPNYLVLVAILLPIGTLLGVRRPAHTCVVPLLLLLTAVEVAEHGLLEATGRQLLDSRPMGGLWALLGPRAGLSLTADPFGLFHSALAAGLAVVWLFAGLLGSRRHAPAALAAPAFLAVVAAPAILVALGGRTTGVVRGQDPFLGGVVAAAAGSQTADGGPVALEAWSQSFRREPPAALRTEDPARPAAATVGGLLRAIGMRDPRLLLLLASILAGALAWRRASNGGGSLAVAALLLSPATAIGVIFGAPGTIALAALLLASTLRSTHPLRAGIATGVAGAFSLAALPAAAPLLAPVGRGQLRTLVGGALLGYLALAVPGMALGAFPTAGSGPGIGLPNLLLYAGLPAGWTLAPAAALFVLTAGVAARTARLARSGARSFSTAAGLALVALWSLPSATANALAVPLGLLAVAGATMVPEAGLEPAWVSPHAPQTCVSANSTTPARSGS